MTEGKTGIDLTREGAFSLAFSLAYRDKAPYCVCLYGDRQRYMVLRPPVGPLTRLVETCWPNGTTTTENFRDRVRSEKGTAYA